LIYTEYVDSQRAAVQAIKAMPGIGTILTMCGDDNDKIRQSVTERFRTQQGIILVSTDSAAEGLNLHQRCHHLIHLELPFNPNRLEQRNGCIDHYGQQHEPIVRYLFLRGTFEDRILLRLIAKYERQRARLAHLIAVELRHLRDAVDVPHQVLCRPKENRQRNLAVATAEQMPSGVIAISRSVGVVQSSLSRQPRIAWKCSLAWTTRSFRAQAQRISSGSRMVGSGIGEVSHG
jgi:superfamily II DNA/RNA helicase